MRLNHLNLCTSDVAALCRVFERHFGFDVEQANADFALLRGRDGFFLVLTKIGADSTQTYPASFHVGFTIEAPADVHAKHAELCAGGCRPGPIKTFDAMSATWTSFYCPVGDGIDIEVNARA